MDDDEEEDFGFDWFEETAERGFICARFQSRRGNSDENDFLAQVPCAANRMGITSIAEATESAILGLGDWCLL